MGGIASTQVFPYSLFPIPCFSNPYPLFPVPCSFPGCTLIDVELPLKQTIPCLAARNLAAVLLAPALLLAPSLLCAQTPSALARLESGPPPSTGGVFPLSQVHAGLSATAWTVFSGSKPEAMDVEILGVLRGARGPGQDMILARLHGAHPEYTGVVAGMSGSPVYIGNKLLGALAYRIGQFSKEPIAGITPIEQMLDVRDLPIANAAGPSLQAGLATSNSPSAASASSSRPDLQMHDFQMMETPLVMSGFRPEAIQLWQQQMAGTTLATIAAGGVGGSSDSSPEPNAVAAAAMLPGSAVSLLLVQGDLEVAATCTVTYIDPKQLLACGHPILQSGTISVPMTAADVVATLSSPLDSFKIINTGATIGAFTEDRASAISGVLGLRARMIPFHITIDAPTGKREVRVSIIDLPSLTPQAMEVVLYNSLIQANDSTADSSYHLQGTIDLDGFAPSPLDVWSTPGDALPAPMQAALLSGLHFQSLYANGARQTTVRAIDLNVQVVPRRMQVTLEAARLISGDSPRAGDTVLVEATLRPWQQPARNIRIPITLPARLAPGNLRLLVSDAGTLDRALDPPRPPSHPPDLAAVLAQDRRLHSTDRVYVSLLVPETQADLAGQTLQSLPLSVANALEPLRSTQEAGLNGESALVEADAPAGGVLNGFQVINLHIDPGGGLH